jgi:hypothetical protein
MINTMKNCKVERPHLLNYIIYILYQYHITIPTLLNFLFNIQQNNSIHEITYKYIYVKTRLWMQMNI